MRHRRKNVKLGRTAAHRDALLANQVCSMIQHLRIKTTLAKAKALRPFAEKMLTLGKRGDVFARRQAISRLHQKDAVKKLFEVIAPHAPDRKGGYTRIIKLGPRESDSAPMAYIEWVDKPITEEDLDFIEGEEGQTPLEKETGKEKVGTEAVAATEKETSSKKTKKSSKKRSKSSKKSRVKKAKAKRTHVKRSRVRSQVKRRKVSRRKSGKSKKGD